MVLATERTTRRQLDDDEVLPHLTHDLPELRNELLVRRSRTTTLADGPFALLSLVIRRQRRLIDRADTLSWTQRDNNMRLNVCISVYIYMYKCICICISVYLCV